MAATRTNPEPAPQGAAPPPQSVESERIVLGAMLTSERAIDTATRLLAPDDFFLPSHGTIFLALTELHNDGVPVDDHGSYETVRHHLRDTRRLNEHVASALLELPSYVGGNVHVHARIVRDEATKYRIRRNLLEQLQAIDEGTDAAAAINRLAASATRLQAQFEAGDETQQKIHAWTPVTLDTGEDDDQEPDRILGLFYPDKRHLLYGEPESLKTWVALAAIAETAQAGRSVFLVDHEMSQRVVRSRLRKLGLDTQALARVHYVKPETALDDAHRPHLAALLDQINPALVVVDAFTGALGLAMLDDASNTDVERWMQTIGALLWGPEKRALLVIDHVVKLEESRGRWPAGSKRKLESSDVAFSVRMVQRLGRGEGENGRAIITRQKDRPAWLPSMKYQAEFLVGNHGEIQYSIVPTASDDSTPFRPTALMERVSQAVELAGIVGTSKKQIEQNVTGKVAYIRQAIDILLGEDYLRATEGGRGKPHVIVSRTPYRETDDPKNPANLVPSSQPRPNLVPDEGATYLVPSSPPLLRGDEVGTRSSTTHTTPHLVPGTEAWIAQATMKEIRQWEATQTTGDPEATS